MTKKKITLIHHCGTIGGSGRSLLQTVNMLSDQYSITVLCPAPSQMFHFLEENGVNVVPYSFPLGSVSYYSGGPRVIGRTFFKELFYIVKNKKQRLQLLKNCDADIFMLNSVTEAFLAKEIKTHTGSACVCFVRETLPRGNRGFFFRVLKRQLQKYCDGVFFISDFDRYTYNLKSLNAVTVRNTVPNRYFEEYGDSKAEALALLGVDRAPEPEDFYVLYLGGNSRMKGVAVICEAMKCLPQNVRLLYAGSHSKARDAYTAEIEDRVEHLGILEDVVPAYRACDLVVFPAAEPHQGRPIFEAGAFGKPAVATDFKELREDITDGVNGAVFPAGDAPALAVAIADIMEGSYKGRNARELAAANKKRSEENHSIASVKKVLEKGVKNALEFSDKSKNGDPAIKYLHIMTAANYTTVNGFTKLVNGHFGTKEHFFVVRDVPANPAQSIGEFENVCWLPNAESTESGILFSYIARAEHVFWHSMGWQWKTQLKMLLHPAYMRKSTWIEWGADLFSWKRTDGNPVTRAIVNRIHRQWRTHVSSVVAIFPTDEKVYRDTFHAKTPVFHAMYSVYHPSLIDAQKPASPRTDGVLHILVGHSATPSCHHMEVLDSLAHFKDEKIRLYIPLTYGEMDYAEAVKKKAVAIFGDKVHFLTENMPLWDYVHFLWDIDVAVFKVYRQIALGNICRLLYMTKKVYMPRGSLLYDFFDGTGTEVYDSDRIEEMTFAEFAQKPRMTEPSQYIMERMNMEKVAAQWGAVFENAVRCSEKKRKS